MRLEQYELLPLASLVEVCRLQPTNNSKSIDLRFQRAGN